MPSQEVAMVSSRMVPKSIHQTCKNCRTIFEITKDDLAFYDKVSPVFGGRKYSIPPPTHCPDCRHQRRYASRDERKLYHRRCDATGKDILSVYSADKPYKVYDYDVWWGDQWDPLSYGRSVDFSRPFFEQFHELSVAVPKMQYSAFSNEHCPYMNRCAYCRNSYMCYDFSESQDCYYCEVGFKLTDSLDCSYSKEMRRCSSCVDSVGCYNSTNLTACSHVSDSHFCFDCHSSESLLFCWNLHNVQYCIWNQQLPREEFLRRRAEFELPNHSKRKRREQDFLERKRKEALHRHAVLINCENCTGDHILESKNCTDCYDVFRGEDLMRVIAVDANCKDSRDCNNAWNAELIYETMSSTGLRNLFSLNVWECSDVLYSEFCKGSSHLFGCSGLHRKHYCILNKQYTKEEYEELAPKLIAHMCKTSEWGEFFPIFHSPFCYNEAKVMELYPLSKEEVIAKRWRWRDEGDEIPKVSKVIPAERLPDSIDDIPDDILNWAITCEATGRPFRIVRQELALYRRMKLPAPHFHPDERHRRRMALRNPRKLWSRKCDKCGKDVRTTYAPGRPETVYCEECYLASVY